MIWILRLLLVFYATTAISAPQCHVSEERQQILKQTFCGENAPELNYRKTGPNCIRESMEARMTDSALQVLGFSICGDEKFARRLNDAILKMAKVSQLLASCVKVELDIEDIYNHAMYIMRDNLRSAECDAYVRNKLERRRPYFESVVELAENPEVQTEVIKKMKMKFDADGNLVDSLD